jgi:glycosyltransferase involved in cell wall biosynthesis
MRILLVSDAWLPQVNGVVRTIESTRDELRRRGHDVEIVGPDRFSSFPCPTYPEIRLAVGQRRKLAQLIEAFDPDAIHISTEGPLGWAARGYCMRRKLSFTTSFHTQFPEYVYLRSGVPVRWTYALLRRFHAPSKAMMVATETLQRSLEHRGFRRLVRWSRGVDTDRFRPAEARGEAAAPIHLSVGRVAVEKNLEAFLSLPVGGPKVVVGNGPSLASFQARYPEVRFTGSKEGAELVDQYAAADVFVFPSRTDTFGLVMLEALACGVPVAAYPVQGPVDVINGHPVGCLDHDLGRAVERALRIPRDQCREFALGYSWQACTDQFLTHLHPFK